MFFPTGETFSANGDERCKFSRSRCIALRTGGERVPIESLNSRGRVDPVASSMKLKHGNLLSKNLVFGKYLRFPYFVSMGANITFATIITIWT